MGEMGMRKLGNREWLVAGNWRMLIIGVMVVGCMQLDTIEYFASSSSSLIPSSSSKIIIEISPMRLDTTGISYYDAVLICNKMSLDEGLDTLYQYDELLLIDDYPDIFWLSNIRILEDRSGYRLPTREEWEQAKEKGEIDDADENVGEWIYRKASSQYAYFYLAPSFVAHIGIYREKSDGPIYGMRVLKVNVY
jgi:hypothetical protein